ncbi:MAG: NAD(P)-dependent oxidoreductase [Candidatus Tectomicrobia bacterium]|uniref:NAD(P)-dependent oxidoreductase n=1 Tax=Tectimicrobiota bacterium TaxID=2528274 RepID=A0A933LQ01_UNCTE|nr:NAD(P)-dependent oxidoreductase [Candidatus Tectomicrobia bacterium]
MKEKIGFIGLGAMGEPMAQNLLNKGYKLTVYDAVKERMMGLAEKGADAARSSKEVAERSDVIITMLPSSPNVREAFLGPEGIMEGVKKGSIAIDMSTIDPVTTRDMAGILLDKGVKMLDAPVARGVSAALAGTLTIYVGGDEEVYQQCKNLLSVMGTDIHYIGEAGAGEIVKIINNVMVATTMCSLAEALVLGVKAGVKPDILFKALSTGSANSFVLQNHVKNCVLEGKFEKEVFPVDYMIKDLDLALITGAKYHVPLYFSSLAHQAYEVARAAGYSENYHPVVIRPLEELTGVEVRREL